ncbi:MAG TPA: hypothetical protein DDZ80_22080 [Cyanobacteria bacterium UBA8803]|nr:hypothetical protein [Cyanobacteria bacterium UBA9273]HBL61020.1 hypothetical protein [Cyanobacteria bacterium UBA8803]
MSNTETLIQMSLPMPITQSNLQIAQQFAAQQPNSQKAQQVYLNTLAVLAVHDYLQLIEIETDLRQSDSWNPVVRMCADIADLQVRGLGKLECRPLLVQNQDLTPPSPPNLGGTQSCNAPAATCSIPPEVWDERIGYVVVEIDADTKQATLLGFAKTAGNGELSLSELESVDALLEHLASLDRRQRQLTVLTQWLENDFAPEWEEVESLVSSAPANVAGDRTSVSPLNLGQWFANIFDAGWQAVEDLFGTENNPQFEFRGSRGLRKAGPGLRRLFPEADVMRAKLVDLGMQLGTKPIALIMALTQERDRKIKILVQVHPATGDRYLPSQLKLSLLSEGSETLQEVQSRGSDLWIQLREFRVVPGTDFSLKLALDDVSIIEEFTL